MKTLDFGLFLTLLFSLFLYPSTAAAELVITLNDDGSGGTHGTIVGTFDVSSGTEGGGGSIFDQFQTGSPSNIFFSRRTTEASNSRSVTYSNDGSQDFIVNTSFSSVPSQLSADDITISLNANASALVLGWDGNESGVINESLDYTSIAFSNFNTGIWTWGGGATSGGITLEIGQAAVPEPSAMSIFLLAVFTFVGFRRRNI